MTLRGKLAVNTGVTVGAVLVIGIASLIGFYEVKDKIRDVTDDSTPRQIKTLEITKALQEHAAALLSVGSASGSELAGKEMELRRTLGRLRTLTSEIGSLSPSPDTAEMGRTVDDVEGLTGEIVASAHERTRAEDRAARLVKEAKVRLGMLAKNRARLQASLKGLQENNISALMRLSSKAKQMTGVFRSLQRVKDLFQEVRVVFVDINRAASNQELAVDRGRLTFLLNEMKGPSGDFKSLVQPLESLDEQLLGKAGLISVKAAFLSHPSDASAGELFDHSWKRCSTLVDRVARLVVENGEDATFAFYDENSRLEDQLRNSDSVNRVMLLNTQMATVLNAIDYSVQNLFAEHSEARIGEMQAVIGRLFASAGRIKARIEDALGPEGRRDERSLMAETAAGIARVEELVMKRGGMIEALKAAAATRARSAVLGDRLARMVEAQKAMSARSLKVAQGRQQRSVGAVNFVVRAATVLLVAAAALVLAFTAALVFPIARSIMILVKDLESARMTAESASRTKSQFLANMSHEIRTPMNGVIGLLELLKAEPLPEKQRSYVSMAFSSGVALLDVINDVLDFSKIEAGHLELNMEEFALHESVEEAVGFFAETAQAKKIELICHVLPGVPARMKGDMARIRQILINLVGNAIKFTDAGEVVVVCGPGTEVEDSMTLRFEVRDTGIGIPPEARSRIFDSFSQADASTTRKFGGTGLGLSIAKQLTQLMGGEIGVESEVGRGSTFWFTVRLSRVPDTGEKDGTAVGDKGSEGLTGLKVLVVDDNPTNRRILEDMLRAWGLCPETAADGPDALRLFRQASSLGAPFRLAILDMMMPGMDGLELARAMRVSAETPRVPMIMLTSVDGKGDSGPCREAGFAARLVKPVRQSQLLNALQSIMGMAEGGQAPVFAAGPKVPPGLSVLLVEDYGVNQKVGRAMLEHLGCSVDVADNGRAALDLYSTKPYDLILMDCQMPEMDGYEATRAIRGKERDKGGKEHIIIVALTAHAMEGDRERSLEAGMDDHLSKPFTLDQLAAVLARYAGPAGDEESARPSPAASAESRQPTEGTAAIDRNALDRIRQIDPDGQDELARTVITCYLTESPKTIDSLRQAVGAGDAETIRALAHGLKSASANVGATHMAESCRQMEAAGRTNAVEKSPGLLLDIETEYARARAALETELR